MNYSLRLQKIRQLLIEMECEALIIEHPTNLLYLTGLELSAGKLYISQQECCLVADGRYFEDCQSQTLYPVFALDQWTLKEWVHAQNIHSLGFDSDQTSYQSYLSLHAMAEELSLSLRALPSPLQKLRLIKDQDEIQLLRKAAQLASEGCRWIISLLSAGVSEEELAFELEFFWKKRGAKKLAFDPIIAFGPNSSKPHHRASATVLQDQMNVLIDIGVVYQHYHSDMTRVVYFGQPDPRIQTIYAIVEEAKQKAAELCRPGTLIGELDQTARSFIASKGYGEYFVHSLGHGIGLDIHEQPTVKAQGPYSQLPLQAGMVLTIEPGIYLPGIGGVRLEDSLLITESGYENLTV